MEAGRCFTTSLFIGKSPQHAAGAAPESHDVKSSNKISADKQGEKRRGYHKKCNYKIEQNKQNHLYSRATLKTPWHSAKRAQSVCFVHAPPVGQWGFYKPVKKSPSLQALTLRSCRARGRLQLYSLSGALRLTGHNWTCAQATAHEATWDSTSTIHLPSSATAKVTGYSHRSCAPRSSSGTVHPLPQMSMPGRPSAAAYPNTGYGSQLIHAQPRHSICGTLLKGLKEMKTQHINWMTLKMGSLGIPRSAVAETIVGGEQCGELCVDTREASFWQGPRAAAASTDTSLSGFICYTRWATWRKLYG